jgi:hypothetical protein
MTKIEMQKEHREEVKELNREMQLLKNRVGNHEDADDKIRDVLTDPTMEQGDRIFEIARILGMSKGQLVHGRMRRAL